MNLPGNSRIYHGGSANKGNGFAAAGSSGISILNTEKLEILHSDMQAAALTNSIILYALPIGAIVCFARMKPDIQFAGTGITSYYLSIGITGAIQDVLAEYNVQAAAINDQEYAEAFCPMSFDYNNTYDIIVSARSIGANLDQSTAGKVTIELYYFSKAV